MNKKYTWIQEVMWRIAGSDISILKDCEGDYNRHANIGLAIFTTTLVALGAGLIAGYQIGGNYIGAIIFGVLWALIVFTIDRNMVASIQKNPDKKVVFWKKMMMNKVFYYLLFFV